MLRPVGEQFELVHGHLHECVYEQLSPIRRKLLHRRVAKALEALHGSDNGRQIRMSAASSQLTEGVSLPSWLPFAGRGLRVLLAVTKVGTCKAMV